MIYYSRYTAISVTKLLSGTELKSYLEFWLEMNPQLLSHLLSIISLVPVISLTIPKIWINWPILWPGIEPMTYHFKLFLICFICSASSPMMSILAPAASFTKLEPRLNLKQTIFFAGMIEGWLQFYTLQFLHNRYFSLCLVSNTKTTFGFFTW